jgi:antirestriction protein ArdC
VITPIEQAEAFVAATAAAIDHSGGRPFYRPSTDIIQLPPRAAFIGTPTSSAAESYYSTLCHELMHWTSAEPRCNRQLGKRFGDHAYAMEELVAELGAAFLCADLRVADEPRADHAQYLASWLEVMKADKKAIFTAASKRSRRISCGSAGGVSSSLRYFFLGGVAIFASEGAAAAAFGFSFFGFLVSRLLRT